MNDRVKEKIDSLIRSIESSDIYKEYSILESKLNENEYIKRLIKDIKFLNKKMVRTPSLKIKKELEEKEKELNSIPIYLEYIDKKEELNNLLTVVKNNMDQFIKEILID